MTHRHLPGNRAVIEQNVDRDPVGRRLTPEARQEAVDVAMRVWRGNMGNGEAAQIGIEQVTSRIFRDE
ncbi:hypothetical protein LCGC14_0252150 [marine sediment metagenome]|uniref:Uncharacterized protein n=1 Tax=marine sediment metagenome TaxID=412755 RepID=A0A0F9X943_9ZZZZ